MYCTFLWPDNVGSQLVQLYSQIKTKQKTNDFPNKIVLSFLMRTFWHKVNTNNIECIGFNSNVPNPYENKCALCAIMTKTKTNSK